jgi:hypothetical protein
LILGEREHFMSLTSDFYLTRAAECGSAADASNLDNVKERYLRSQAAWLTMANRTLKGEAMRDEAASEKARRLPLEG